MRSIHYHISYQALVCHHSGIEAHQGHEQGREHEFHNGSALYDCGYEDMEGFIGWVVAWNYTCLSGENTLFIRRRGICEPRETANLARTANKNTIIVRYADTTSAPTTENAGLSIEMRGSCRGVYAWAATSEPQQANANQLLGTMYVQYDTSSGFDARCT